jgi:hypothetical protein
MTAFKKNKSNGFLFFALMAVMLCQYNQVNAAGVKYYIELEIYHYPTEEEPGKITYSLGKEPFDTKGLCVKAYLSPEYKLGIKAYYHGKGVAGVKSTCIKLLPDEIGA